MTKVHEVVNVGRGAWDALYMFILPDALSMT